MPIPCCPILHANNVLSNNNNTGCMFICIIEWVQEYHLQYPDSTKLQAEVDEFMAKFDERKEQVQQTAICV